MARFKVVGNHTVDGVAPGKTLTVDDEVRARRLVRAGHLSPAPKPAPKPTSKPKGR